MAFEWNSYTISFYTLIGIVAWQWWRWKRRGYLTNGIKRLPVPGGRGYLNGHACAVDRISREKLIEWRTSLGDIYMIYVKSQPCVVLASAKVVDELLQKRATKYSSRRPNYYISDVIERRRNYAISPFNAYYQKIKLIATPLLFKHPLLPSTLDQHTVKLLKSLFSLRVPCDPTPHLRLFTISSLLSHLFGISSPTSVDDRTYQRISKLINEYIRYYEKIENTSRAGVGLPNLKGSFEDWGLRFGIPGSTYKEAIRLRDKLEDIVLRLIYKMNKENVERNCLAKELMGRREKGEVDIMDIVHTLGCFIVMGVSSLTHSLTVLTTQLAQTPYFQSILSTELSLPHLPALSDRPSCHFTTSFIKQTLLHHPAWLPIPPRYAQVDDEYRGFHIPKGALVLVDESVRGGWDKDRPGEMERNLEVGDTNMFEFGYGKRMCPAVELSESLLFLAFSRIVWFYKIVDGGIKSKQVGNGRPSVSFTPRREGLERLLFDESS